MLVYQRVSISTIFIHILPSNFLMCPVQINTEPRSWGEIKSFNNISPTHTWIRFCSNQSLKSKYLLLSTSSMITVPYGVRAEQSHGKPQRSPQLSCEVHLCVSQRGMQDAVASQPQHARWGGPGTAETARNTGVSWVDQWPFQVHPSSP